MGHDDCRLKKSLCTFESICTPEFFLGGGGGSGQTGKLSCEVNECRGVALEREVALGRDS